MTKSSRTPYFLITGIYVALWIVGFSRLHEGPYLVIGCFAALGYGSGQLIEATLRQHITLSADPIALPGAALMTAAGTWWCLTHGQLHLASGLYLDIVERFLVSFLLGHTVVMLSALVVDAVTTAVRNKRMP